MVSVLIEEVLLMGFVWRIYLRGVEALTCFFQGRCRWVSCLFFRKQGREGVLYLFQKRNKMGGLR